MIDIQTYKFNTEEVKEVLLRFPKLHLLKPDILEGDIEINAKYDEIEIKDTFTIRVINQKNIPKVFEIGGRVEKIEEKYNVKQRIDLHIYNDKSVCFGVFHELKLKFPEGSKLITFFDNLVIPFFYALSFYEKYKYWAWGEYSHGSLGILESYFGKVEDLSIIELKKIGAILRYSSNWKDINIQFRRPSGEKSCVCGSSKSFEKCHPKAYQGLMYLYLNMKKKQINANKIFVYYK